MRFFTYSSNETLTKSSYTGLVSLRHSRERGQVKRCRSALPPTREKKSLKLFKGLINTLCHLVSTDVLFGGMYGSERRTFYTVATRIY